MNREIKLIEFPEKIIPKEWRKEHDITLLEIGGKCEVLENLLQMYKDSRKDFKSLISTIKMQLESEHLLRNRNRLQRGKSKEQKDIIEFKAPKGHARLFGFIDGNNGKIIVCTNTYWKTSGNKKEQNNAFNKAANLKRMYFEAQKGE